MAIVHISPPPAVIMSPDEARTRTCPLVRYLANESNVIQDGQAAIYYHANCVAAECLGWRWARGEGQKYFVTMRDKPEEAWNWNPSGQPGYDDCKVRIETIPPQGFCGLAGQP
jgi:hypothetical protein